MYTEVPGQRDDGTSIQPAGSGDITGVASFDGRTLVRSPLTKFRNEISLHPVCDTDGAYRFMIGLLVDADAISSKERQLLVLIRRLLPTVSCLARFLRFL